MGEFADVVVMANCVVFIQSTTMVCSSQLHHKSANAVVRLRMGTNKCGVLSYRLNGIRATSRKAAFTCRKNDNVIKFDGAYAVGIIFPLFSARCVPLHFYENIIFYDFRHRIGKFLLS